MRIATEVQMSDNGFVFNAKTGDSFSLNPFAIELMKLIQLGNEFDIIQKIIQEKYDVNKWVFEKDFYEFIAVLKHYQIAVEDDTLKFE